MAVSPRSWIHHACLVSAMMAAPSIAGAQQETAPAPTTVEPAPLTPPAPAMTTGFETPAPASPQQADEIRRKDNTIRDLQQRVDQLEKRLNASPAFRTEPIPQAASTGAADDTGEEVSERALEWALIRQGGLLLAPWSFELQPGMSYSYRAVGTLLSPANGSIIDVPSVLRNETLITDVALRLGLPMGSQVEVYVPYVLDARRDVAFAPLNFNQTQTESGLGDISVTLSKQLLTESGPVPNLLAALSWKSTTGDSGGTRSPNQPSLISIGSGYHTVLGSLTAVKSQEPLVFLGSLSYAANLSETVNGADLNPGDSVGLRVGTILAASPDTSWRLAFNLARYTDTELNGVEIPGSDVTTGLLEIGVSSVISAKTLLDVTAGVGLTESSSDFTLSVAMPIRFF